MGFLGTHTVQPYGNPEALKAIQEAYARGDTASINAIAAGGHAHGIRGINDSYNYGENTASGQSYRQFAKDLLEGNSSAVSQRHQQAAATYKPWSGGWGADLAPIAAAFIPGIGPIAAGAIGAGIGGAEAAGGVTNRSVGAGALQGGIEAGGANYAKGKLSGGSGTAPVGSTGTAGVGDLDPTTGAFPGSLDPTSVLPSGTAPVGSAGGGFLGTLEGLGKDALGYVTKNPGVVAAGIQGIAGAGESARADALRNAAANIVTQPLVKPDLSSQFSIAPNPYRPGTAPVTGTNAAQRAGIAALRSH